MSSVARQGSERREAWQLREQGVIRNWGHFSIAADRVPGGGSLQVAKSQVPDHVTSCLNRLDWASFIDEGNLGGILRKGCPGHSQILL